MKEAMKHELAKHLPFTLFGAVTGVIVMLVFRGIAQETAHRLFYVLHPIHVFLSAIVTASLFAAYKYGPTKNPRQLLSIFVIGYVGAVGIATLSDSVIPHIGELLLNMPYAHAHIGFLEKWWLIHSAAIAGILVAYFRPTTHFSHTGHVLISTWASLFHVLMAKGESLSIMVMILVFIFLTLSVWIPCCVSDIIFPLLFIKKKADEGQD